ncbi:aldo-keto reductase-like protein [Lineolata rhizophorae]|uniref:Aldo-keto reductase-like protein n=1 Tax=Lineolata rhizophorae TaxID=578093 RepID=A0A6A6P734_9PEZI|nr:aldo-keto reductase-like protein [Lineolata rhizophorae]
MAFEGLANNVLRLAGSPPFIYGTAWKKGNTTALVKEALAAGFKAVDTAGQPKHYEEDLVGDALRETFKLGKLRRESIFLQTKFTSPPGHDLNNMPYDINSPLDTQLRDSISSSLYNLRPSDSPDSVNDSYIDCLLLHSPLRTMQTTLQAWSLLETYVPHQIRSLGISNVTAPELQAIYESAKVKPAVVQNRFYPATRYDVPVRDFCTKNGILYESFWTLTANPQLRMSEPVRGLSQLAGVSGEVALYALVMDLGIAVLNGTTSAQRMREDLEAIVTVKKWAGEHPGEWEFVRGAFRGVVQSA